MSSAVLAGVAGLLDVAGVATYRGDGTAYEAGETAITFGVLPTTPDRAIALAVYHSEDAPTQPDGVVRLQLMCRGLPNQQADVDDLAQDAFAVLHGLVHQQFGPVHAVQILRTTSVWIGQDRNRRTERSDNYHVDTSGPATANRSG